MSSRRTLILSFLGGIALTFATSWLLATRALDTPRPGQTAGNGNPVKWIDISRYDKVGSVDVRCLASTDAWGKHHRSVLRPEELTPEWMRDLLIPWGWNNQRWPGAAFSVRTVKVSGWPLPCLYSVYEAVPNPAMWPHKAISGIAISDTWTGFGPQYPGEMPVAFPYRPRWFPFLLNVLFYAAISALVLTVARRFRTSRREGRGHCRACNYDLRGLAPGSPCPECGAPPTARVQTEPACHR